MTRAYRSRLLTGLGATLLASIVLAQTSEVGTWKLNVEKSKYSPGPAVKSGATRIEAVGESRRWIVDQVQVDGTAAHWEFTVNFDGKDSPVTGNNPNADMVAATRISPTTIQLINKKNGKVTTTQTSVISPDGKTRTVTTKGVTPAAQPLNNISVYERQ
jgi:histidinol dehydrogenase